MDSFPLIEELKNSRVLHSPAVIEAFEKIDRKEFVPEELYDFAYADEALPIGFGQTISQPHVVAFMLELLGTHAGNRILDVGSGSGYTTALLAAIVGPSGRVFGVEIIPELVAYGRKNLGKFHFGHAEICQTSKALGLPREAPFDKILVSASAPKITDALVSQLKIGGKMVASIGGDIISATKIHDGTLETQKYGGFSFVPLIENPE